MNFTKLYSQAIGSEPAEDTSSQALDGKKQAEHLAWYRLQQTQDFIETLQKEWESQVQLAVTLACQGADEKPKDKALIRAENLKQIIDYARTNRRSSSRNAGQ